MYEGNQLKPGRQIISAGFPISLKRLMLIRVRFQAVEDPRQTWHHSQCPVFSVLLLQQIQETPGKQNKEQVPSRTGVYHNLELLSWIVHSQRSYPVSVVYFLHQGSS